MSQKLWSSLTATLLVITFSAAKSSYADQPQVVDQGLKSNSSQPSPSVAGEAPYLNNPDSSKLSLSPPSNRSLSPQVVKVGEAQSQDRTEKNAAIAKITSHTVAGRPAATLYVRNIPVLSFVSSATVNPSSSKLPTVDGNKNSTSEMKLATHTQPLASGTKLRGNEQAKHQNDPIWRASTVAAKLNQLSRAQVDANAIKVKWDQGDRYTIQIEGQPLVELNAATLSPDSTRDPAQDALQVANRLRRLMGNAPPIQDIAGRPANWKKIFALGNSQQAKVQPFQVTRQVKGLASWYGPGFHGAMSASGEIFNQNALTAAHPNLPFGTKVRVTNLDNGRSIVVRINDRGPYIGGRIIDLSSAAANVLGLIQSGVAPVRLDILGGRNTL